MDVSGAIFDCDGTLVDSMGMWTHAYEWLYDHYGSEGAPMDVVEPMALADACRLFHDEYGMGSSGEEVYETLTAHVRDAYEREVALMPGAREFLDELSAAGIPMIVASSTPKRELWHALCAHGLDGYFMDAVSTEAWRRSAAWARRARPRGSSRTPPLACARLGARALPSWAS